MDDTYDEDMNCWGIRCMLMSALYSDKDIIEIASFTKVNIKDNTYRWLTDGDPTSPYAWVKDAINAVARECGVNVSFMIRVDRTHQQRQVFYLLIH